MAATGIIARGPYATGEGLGWASDAGDCDLTRDANSHGGGGFRKQNKYPVSWVSHDAPDKDPTVKWSRIVMGVE